MSNRYSIEKSKLLQDLQTLIVNINMIINDEYSCTSIIEEIPYSPDRILYPVLSEIALTYSCQNRCDFCYASSPYRGNPVKEMTTDEVKTVIEKIRYQAHVPTISFTGGEPTMRDDLPEIISYASNLGMRTNLITNGIKCSNRGYVDTLFKAGLNSAQVSLESHSEVINQNRNCK